MSTLNSAECISYSSSTSQAVLHVQACDAPPESDHKRQKLTTSRLLQDGAQDQLQPNTTGHNRLDSPCATASPSEPSAAGQSGSLDAHHTTVDAGQQDQMVPSDHMAANRQGRGVADSTDHTLGVNTEADLSASGAPADHLPGDIQGVGAHPASPDRTPPPAVTSASSTSTAKHKPEPGPQHLCSLPPTDSLVTGHQAELVSGSESGQAGSDEPQAGLTKIQLTATSLKLHPDGNLQQPQPEGILQQPHAKASMQPALSNGGLHPHAIAGLLQPSLDHVRHSRRWIDLNCHEQVGSSGKEAAATNEAASISAAASVMNTDHQCDFGISPDVIRMTEGKGADQVDIQQASDNACAYTILGTKGIQTSTDTCVVTKVDHAGSAPTRGGGDTSDEELQAQVPDPVVKLHVRLCCL